MYIITKLLGNKMRNFKRQEKRHIGKNDNEQMTGRNVQMDNCLHSA